MAELLPNLGYYNGTYDRIEKMMIPMTDRVCWFGDGVYDATCTKNRTIYCLSDHIDRFFRSAALVKIDLPFSKEELASLLQELILHVDTSETKGETFLYWQVTRGAGTLRNHAFPEGVKPNLWVTVTPREVADTYRRVHLISREDIRYHMCNVKTMCLLPNVLASEAAKEAGADECVQYRILPDGSTRVTEGAHTNVHCLKDGVFYTAPLDELILPGISRKNLIAACNALSVPVKEVPYSLDFYKDADELMISSSSNFCLAADLLDGCPVGGKDPVLLKRLQDYLVADFEQKTAL